MSIIISIVDHHFDHHFFFAWSCYQLVIVNLLLCRFASRLTGIKENAKFQKNGLSTEQVPGLKHVVEDAKEHHNVK